jgi:hypothetical protein
MRRPRRTQLQVESLEGKALLSGVHAAPLAAHAIEVRQAGPVGNALLNNSDVQALQQLASANNTVAFLTELTMLENPRINANPSALQALNDGRDLDLALHQVSDPNGLPLPADIQGADKATANLAVSGINTRRFGQRDSAALLQAGNSLVNQLQQLANSPNSELSAIGQTFLPVAGADMQNLKTLLQGGTPSVPTPPPTTPSSNGLGASDLQTLEKAYSTNLTERFLGQLTALETRNHGTEQYAEKLISDHEHAAVQIGNYALSTQTYLPANIQGQNAMLSGRILRTANRRAYNRVYLQSMVQAHTMDILDNERTIATTTNPVLKQLAMEDLGTDWMHRASAQLLLRRMRR